MLRRDPTRIELKLDDVMEFHQMQIESAKTQQDVKKTKAALGKLQQFVRENKQDLKTTIDVLHKPQSST